MKNLTDSAQNRLDKYLNQARTSLHTYTSVDADEVQRDIREHIETELQGMSEPVSLKDLEAVLDRLGSPSQWVPEEDLSWWRKIILRLRKGPEDWRLAYITFGLFILWLLSLHFGGRRVILGFLILGPFAILQGFGKGLLLLLSFILARATISVVGNAKELRGQKWLIYPSLLFVYVPLIVFIIIWPVIPVVIIAESQTHAGYHPTGAFLRSVPNYRSPQFYTFWISMGSAAIGLWWTILGIFSCVYSRLVQAVFRPFADNFKRRHAILFIIVSVILLILGGIMLALFLVKPLSAHSSPVFMR